MEAPTKATMIAAYSLCDADCEDGHHNGDFATCERCGSMIHSRVFKVDHSRYGYITVGSECFKEVMGWSWKKSHENALELYMFLKEWLAKTEGKIDEWLDEHRRLPGAGVRADDPRLYVHAAEGKRTLVFVNVPHLHPWKSYEVIVGPREYRLKTPHGFNRAHVLAGLDIGLWSDGHPFDTGNYGSGNVGVVLDFSRQPLMTEPPPPMPKFEEY